MDRLSLLSVKVKSPEHQHMRYKTAILTTTLLPTCTVSQKCELYTKFYINNRENFCSLHQPQTTTFKET
ncbi:hypothetical protein T4A_2555 [Trichinella pseudospiralis]|uniref:Uncharacterized protein n=1 Tax=Trichinella pseudospiralis TaxID=6337 RepID=A0A0V1JN84_TRIPS|nr:hypothetical protein T4A_2555 [Trichinella pseudospiralis]KRZ36037.1 hypothetical protein T4C_9903 [Trichinella pseudospiralis]